MQKLAIEAIIVGVFIMIIGTIMAGTIGKLFKVDLPPVCSDWNRNYTMEISLFATGVLGHLLFEGVGANKWYCKNGNACQ